MDTRIIAFVSWAAVLTSLQARVLHVFVAGKDSDEGTRQKPLRTIQCAADHAQPGDTIIVHEGTYRERINPPRGGDSDARRIVYQAAAGEMVEIKGSERIQTWKHLTNDTWQVALPNAFFGAFNPYRDRLHGDWFNPKKREHHTGAVYINGTWLSEADNDENVLKPVVDEARWWGVVDAQKTLLLAQFKGVDPNVEQVEINVRQTLFYPEKPGINYITVRGFTMRHAATPWAPPTAEQIGLIGTHWSKGWVIENNVISHAICSGISLGKHGDSFDNTSADTAEGYVKTIERAHAFRIPWEKASVGGHVVRSNHISHCEQAGIVGSMGCSFSTITDNVLHDIHVRQLFTGAEMAAIKFHGAIDTEISRNRIYRSSRGLWLDWMAQGTRVSRNVFYRNSGEDLFMEVNHGPFLIDNNLFLSAVNLWDWSEGGAYAHNLFAGQIWSRPELSRETPYHPAHSTVVAGLANIKSGDNRYYNNLFVGPGGTPDAIDDTPSATARKTPGKGFGLAVYDACAFPLFTGGNVYFNGAKPYHQEKDAVISSAQGGPITVIENPDGVYLHAEALKGAHTTGMPCITTERLGVAKIPQVPYVNPDGSPIAVNIDYFGNVRSSQHPLSGPFEKPIKASIKIWSCETQ